MTEADITSALTQGGPLLVALFFLGRAAIRVLEKGLERLIAALDKLIAKLDEHTKLDLAAQGEVREELVSLGARIDTVMDLTPVRATKPRAQTSPQGYRTPRPGYRDEE